jgi:hypothetical protein
MMELVYSVNVAFFQYRKPIAGTPQHLFSVGDYFVGQRFSRNVKKYFNNIKVRCLCVTAPSFLANGRMNYKDTEP